MFGEQTALVLREATALSRRQETAIEQKLGGLLDLIDQQVSHLGQAVIVTYDPFEIRMLKLQMEEWRKRKGLVRNRMQELLEREHEMFEQFLRYREGLLAQGEVIDFLAEVDGIDTSALRRDYQKFKELVKQEWRLPIADRVLKERYVKELEVQLESRRVQEQKLRKRLLEEDRAFAHRTLGRRRSGTSRY